MQNRLICMQFTVAESPTIEDRNRHRHNQCYNFVAFRNGFVIVTDGKSDQTVTQLESQQSAEGLVQMPDNEKWMNKQAKGRGPILSPSEVQLLHRTQKAGYEFIPMAKMTLLLLMAKTVLFPEERWSKWRYLAPKFNIHSDLFMMSGLHFFLCIL